MSLQKSNENFDFYNELSNSYDALYKEEQYDKYRLVSDLFQGNILDLGCGSGLLIQYLIENKIKFKTYVGIDNSKKLIELARRKLNQFDINENIKIKLIEHDVETFDYKLLLDEFQMNKFDLVVSFTAIHHFNTLDFLLKIPSKRFIISVLKKAKNHDMIEHFIEENFYIEKRISEYHDMIYILH